MTFADVRPLAIVATAVLALSACQPLEQAPLIYSAADKGGIFISASPSNSSVADISVGWSVIDTAYVPVEVAKHCDPKDAASCQDKIYKMKDVRGSATNSDSLPPSATDIHSLAEAYADADAKQKLAQQALEEAQKTQTGHQALLLAVSTADAAAATDQANVAALTAQQIQSPNDADIKAKVAAANAQLTADERKQSQAQQLAQSVDASTTAKDAQAVLDAQTKLTEAAGATDSAWKALQNAFGANNGDVKADALSVYGSFNDATTANPSNAAIALGKVFSTGVAAQNISVGVSAAAVAACIANATTAASLTNDSSKQQAILTEALTACGKTAH